MKHLSYFKLIITAIITLVAIIYALPNFLVTNPLHFITNKTLNLGLDLKGGSHLLLKVEFNKYIDDQLSILADQIRKELQSKKIGYKNFSIKDNTINFSLRSKEQASQVETAVKNIEKHVDITLQEENIRLIYTKFKLLELKANVFDQSIEIVRMRVDSTGTKEPTIQKQGDDYIILQVPGEENPEYLKKILGQTAKLSFHRVVDSYSSHIESSENHKKATLLLNFKNEYEGLEPIQIEKTPILTGDMLTYAQATFTHNNEPAVSFALNTTGTKLFAEATKYAKGKRIAIVLDDKILSAPSVNEPITGGSGLISGSFTLDGAEELALMLRAGALPAPLEIVEEKLIGPELGSDSIESGKRAGIIGFVGVAIFMLWSYGILGFFANIALVLSMTYIVALLTIIGATLTLPGIAGIILTIGMAVDANVLIFERIREESRKASVSQGFAINKGFEAAFATISDSNITTLISALILYIFGTGAVKGFAVSLSIGIICSMFSAIIVTKLLIDWWVMYYKPKSLGL
ncbi:MAG: protein translocase subunit SecD [Rickettsiaceae bacterium]|nr:protein translocase subunit SecD [Rickettsiaceae bacterium]